MKRKILFFSLMLTFLFASCSNLIDELTVTKEKEANYTVTISDKIENGTVTASPTTAAAGTEITLTAEPASGYSFGSYSVTDADGNSVKVENGKFKMPASNVNVSATFTTVTYTVTVASDIVNGTVTASPTTAAAGTEITLSVTPATGYQFATLTVTDADGKAVTVTDNKFTMPASNVTVSATFTALPPATASYTVKHLQQNIADNNYTLKESETKTGTVGQSTAASEKSYYGFTAQTVTQVTVAASGTEVEIKYDRNTYTVTFDSNDGSNVSSQSLRYGAKATKPADPTKTATATTEYTFAGWYSDSGLESAFDFETAITADITLYAKWTAAPITYEAYLVTEDDTAETLTNKVVQFNEIEWYIIKDESTAANAGTITLLAKDKITKMSFITDGSDDKYSNSTVKEYLEGLTNAEGSFAGVSEVIETVKVKASEDDAEVDAKIWLLSIDEANQVPNRVRKSDWDWWLRSPGSSNSNAMKAACVRTHGAVDSVGQNVKSPFNIRPALKLNLSKMIFDSTTSTFTVVH